MSNYIAGGSSLRWALDQSERIQTYAHVCSMVKVLTAWTRSLQSDTPRDGLIR